MMSYRNILCTYSGNSPRASGLTFAAGIVRRQDGWLTAVLRHGTPRLETRYATRLPSSVIASLHQADNELIAQARARFARIVDEAGLTERAEFVELAPERGETLSEFARCFDLVVCAQGTEQPNEAHLAARPDEIALSSGRPVLLVPQDFEYEGPTEHALIAWDGKRAAARAVGDALPLLQEKARVTVLTVGRDILAQAQKPGLMEWLQRHGIRAETLHVEAERRSVPQIILETADTRGAGLVVMGAFEHSRLSQELWGGVTSGMLHQARQPVFMSH